MISDGEKIISDNYELILMLDKYLYHTYLISSYDIYYNLMPSNINEYPLTDFLFIDSGGYGPAIRTHLNEIEKTLGKEIEGIEQILFGGSLSKKTFVEGISDVDALVVIKPDIASGPTPEELQNKFYDLQYLACSYFKTYKYTISS